MPQFQVLQPNPGFGSQLGAALGGGIGQGFQSTVSKYFEKKQNERALTAFEPLFKEAGLNKDEISQIIKSGIDPKIAQEALKLKMQQKQLADYNKSFEGVPSASEEFSPQQQMQPELAEQEIQAEAEQGPMENGMQKPSIRPKTITAPESSKVQPILATKQIPNPVNVAQIPQHATARQAALTRADKLTAPGREERRLAAKEAEEIEPLMHRAKQLVKKGSISGMAGYLQANAGERFPFVKGQDVKEIQRIMKETAVKRFRSDFGARPSQSEFFYINDVYLKPGDPKESMERSIKVQEEMGKLARKTKEIESQIYQQYKEYPTNLDDMVSERMAPYRQQMMKNLGYDDYAKKHPEIKEMPSAVGHAGKPLTDTKTGKKYISNGEYWEPISG